MGSLLLVRHAQASLFAKNYDQLSELGRTQAGHLGRHFEAVKPSFTRVITGPAQRHIDTLALACEAADAKLSLSWPSPTVIPDFDEHDAFNLVAKAVPELLPTDPKLAAFAKAAQDHEDPGARSAAWQAAFELVMRRWLADEINPEGVETWKDFRGRVQTGLRELLSTAANKGGKQRILLVSSVGPSAVILGEALGLTPVNAFRLAWRQRNCSRTRFVFRRDELSLDAYNLVDHLPPQMHTHR